MAAIYYLIFLICPAVCVVARAAVGYDGTGELVIDYNQLEELMTAASEGKRQDESVRGRSTKNQDGESLHSLTSNRFTEFRSTGLKDSITKEWLRKRSQHRDHLNRRFPGQWVSAARSNNKLPSTVLRNPTIRVITKSATLGAVQDHHTYTMYHGTSCRVAKTIQKNGFKPSTGGMLGSCVYMSRDIAKTSYYYKMGGKLQGSNGCVVKADVDVGVVKTITYQPHPMQRNWMNNGYDSAWVPPNSYSLNPSGREESCIKDPTMIRVITVCTFSQVQNNNC